MRKRIFSLSDARTLARWRMPKMMFDYIDGSAENEFACDLNCSALQQVRLLPRVLVNTESRSLGKKLFDRQWSLPFGIAPMACAT